MMTKQRSDGDGSVYLLKSRNRWHYAYYDINGKRITRVARPNTERGAEAGLRKALALRDKGETTAKTMTIAAWCAAWLETRRIAGVRPRSIDTYRMRMQKHVIPTLGHLKLDKLTPAHLDALYSKLADGGMASNGVVQIHRTIGSMLNVAKRRRLIGHAVMGLVEPPRFKRNETRTPTADELRDILTTIKGHRHQAMWTFIIGTGVRYGEAAGLTWGNVDLGNATALICQQATRLKDANGVERMGLAVVKTDAGRREIHLPSFVVAALRHQHIAVATMRLAAGPRWRDLDLCFPSHLGAPLTSSPVGRDWHAMLRSIGLEGEPGKKRLRIHDLRHGYATLMVDEGEALVTIQRALGHARASITADWYVGSTAKAQRAAADRFGVLLDISKHHDE